MLLQQNATTGWLTNNRFSLQSLEAEKSRIEVLDLESSQGLLPGSSMPVFPVSAHGRGAEEHSTSRAPMLSTRLHLKRHHTEDPVQHRNFG